jgi:hypothetical protein
MARASSSKATGTRRFIGPVDGKLVMSSAEVLDEGVPGDHNPGAAVLLEPAHRTQP